MLIPADGAMGALAEAIGVGIKNKTALKQRADDIDERVMHDAIPKRRGADHARLRLVNLKSGILAGLIDFACQLFLQTPKIFFETIEEMQHVGLLALAGRRLLRREQK